jgi:hypothetical protein
MKYLHYATIDSSRNSCQLCHSTNRRYIYLITTGCFKKEVYNVRVFVMLLCGECYGNVCI